MSIENLNRWHWLLLSVVIGFAGAWIMLAMGPRPAARERTVGAQTFEAAALGRPTFGASAAKDEPIEIYPKDGAFVAMVMLKVSPRADEIPSGVPARLVTKLAEHTFTPAPGTYFPVNHLATPPHFQVSFRKLDVDLPELDKSTRSDPSAWFSARELREQLPTRTTGLTSAGVGMRWIGDEGATLEFPLQQNAADLTILAAEPKADLGRELSIALNGKPLTPLARVGGAASMIWTTRVPAVAIVEGSQSLSIVRKQTPIAITGVRVIDPAYSLVDFLTDAKKSNPKLQTIVHVSWLPSRMYIIWVSSSVTLIGLVWPTLIQMMARAGLANRPKERAYDLDRFKSEAKTEVASPVFQDDDQLLQLEKEVERQLAAAAEDEPQPVPVARRSDMPITTLSSEMVETPSSDDSAAAPKVFGGEYYPVAKKLERKGSERA